MPSWGMHLKISNLLLNKFKDIDKNEFMIGNILPDINNGYVIKDINKRIEHRVTHYEENENFNNYERFYFKYKRHINDPIILGYLTHLLTDYYFNNLTYSERGIYNNLGELIGIKLNSGEDKLCEKEIIRQIKTGDFRIFADYIYKNKEINKLKYNENILEINDIIKEINVTKKDIEKSIEYINSNLEKKDFNEKNYKIFTQEEMIEHSKLCTEFIMQYLNIN